MGLGLAVARKIVAMHHGKLEIRPAQEGHGGIVALFFPTEGAEPAKADKASASLPLVSRRA